MLTGGGYGETSEVERYIQKEINPSIELMSQKGFSSVNFAVPFSRRNPAYLEALKQKFYFVRTGAWLPEGGDITKVKNAYYTCSDQLNNRRLLESFGLSNEDKFPLSTISLAMEHAYQTNSVVSMHLHAINESGTPWTTVTREKLENILSRAVEIGLKFYTTIQLRTHCI